MNILFLMDPLETVHYHKDTSFIFMIGAARAEHNVFYLPKGGVSLQDGELFFDVTAVTPQRVESKPFVEHGPQRLTGDEVDVVFVRTDPPFDQDYLTHTWMLDHLGDHALVINSPHGLRAVNEKLWCTQFKDLLPPTLVTRRIDLFSAFVAEHGRVIAKPLDGHGGEGVFVVKAGDSNMGVIFETLSENGRRDFMTQCFIPEAAEGDKRIVLWNGEPMGAVMRVHDESDHRNNFFAGGTAQPAKINQRDLEIIERLKPHLRELGLLFVGIDVIGDYLIEVNVTSPTCVQEINRLDGVQLEDTIIAGAAELVEQKRAAV